jgi:hypothetical protein
MAFLSTETSPSCSPHSPVQIHRAKHPGALSLALLAVLIFALIGREDIRLPKLATQLPNAALQSSHVKQGHALHSQAPVNTS